VLRENGYRKGINLGGWMSQSDYSRERLDGFITEKDFARIAGWGLDHVRLPVDHNVILDADGNMIEEGLQRIDRVLRWAEKEGLRVVLDLHKTPGFSFGQAADRNSFFESEANQNLFYRIWETFAGRYAAMGTGITFDLLNEVTYPQYLEPWIRISRETTARIREPTGRRPGGTSANGIPTRRAACPRRIWNRSSFRPSERRRRRGPGSTAANTA